MADQKIRGTHIYRTLLMWPYAVAPAVAASLWLFIFHPSIGVLGRALNDLGILWDYKLNGTQALLLVILASAWKQVSYNFLFFLAGLQAIPRSVIEAASMDAGLGRTFWSIVFPLLSPTTFFVAIMAVIDSFQAIDQVYLMTQGGPGNNTNLFIFYIYQNAFRFFDFGYASAVSGILFLILLGLTVLAFRTLHRRVHYA